MTNPAALSALAKGDIQNFLTASAPGGIERQEAEGQRRMASSFLTLPKDMDREPALAFGFAFGEDSDDIFVNVTAPEGWSIHPTEHSMHSKSCRVRAGMNVLVACERSGVVRNAFRARGHNAWSCDLESADDGGLHLQMDAIHAAYSQPWDLLIGHPECTYLSNSGAKHLYAGMNKANGPNPDRWAHMGAAASFFMALWNAPIPMIALENPIMLGHPKRLFGIPEPAQIIQPWQFGHGETKATCLWLKGLPALAPTNVVEGREQRVFRMAPGPDRKKERSRTFEGIAEAMARQWGSLAERQEAA